MSEQDHGGVSADAGPGEGWWLQRDGQTFGPYDLATLRFILQDNRAQAADPVAATREGPWRRLGDVIASLPPPPPPPETPAPPPAAPAPPPASNTRFTAGFLGCLAVIAAFIAIPVFTVGPLYRTAQAKAVARTAESCLQQAHAALETYALTNDGRLPPPGQWETALSKILPNPDQLQGPGHQDFIFNDQVGGKPLDALPPATELARDPFPYDARYRAHAPGTYVLTADGAVKLVPPRTANSP